MLTQVENGDIHCDDSVVMIRGHKNQPLGKLRFSHLNQQQDFRFAFTLQITADGSTIQVYDLATLTPDRAQPPALIGSIVIRGHFHQYGSLGVYDEWDGLIESITVSAPASSTSG